MRVLLTSAGLETEEIKDYFVKMLGKAASEVKALFIPTAAIDAGAIEVLPKCMERHPGTGTLALLLSRVALKILVFLCFLSCKVFQNGNVITRNIDSVGFFSVHQFYDVVAVAVNAAIGIR